MEIPELWQDLAVESWHGPILLVGSSDSGKTTFAQYCHQRLLASRGCVGFIDLDVGQNAFGLPTTAALGISRSHDDVAFPPAGERRHVFIGNITPVGVEARVLAALHRLIRAASCAEVAGLIIDTSGFVDISHGAGDLKWAKVELARPCTVVALQREAELAPIIEPLQHAPDVDVIALPVSEHVQTRSREARRAYRRECYKAVFQDARKVPLHPADLALFAGGPWRTHQLVALEDGQGFVVALATIAGVSEAVLWLRTPWRGAGEMRALRTGHVWLEPDSFEDHYLDVM